MNLAWHIAKKDMRRFWGPVALLIVIAALRFGVGMSLLLSDDSDRLRFMHMEVYANLLCAIWIFVTYLLVAAIVQEDAVAGPAFWQTRPISGLGLLAGKALGLFLTLGLLPVLVSTPWWLACGFGGSEICRAAAETLAVQMGVVLLALPLAAVTGDYGRFLLWTVVGVVAVFSIAIINAGHMVATNQPTWTDATRMLVIGLAAAAGGAAVVVHQFLTRRTWRSIAIIAITALSMLAARQWWTADGSAVFSPRPNAPVGIARDVKISFEGATDDPTMAGNNVVNVALLAQSVPLNYVLRPFYSEQTLRWADGSITKQLFFSILEGRDFRFAIEPYHFFQIKPPTPNLKAWQYIGRRELIPFTPRTGIQSGRYEESFFIVLAPGETAKLAGEKPDYDGTFWLRLFKPELVDERSLSAGSEFAKGSIRTRVAAIRKDERTQVLQLSLIEREPESLWNDFMEPMGLAVPGPQPSYYAVNRTRTYVTEGLNETRNRVLIAGVAIALRREAFRGHTNWNESAHKWELEPASLDGGTLAEVNYREVERFSLPLSVGKLAVRQTPPLGSVSLKNMTCTVTGEVSKVGELDVPSGANLVDALRRAGGVSDRADLSAVTLTRTVAGGAPTTVGVDVEAWLENPKRSAAELLVLKPGDVINVPAREAPPTR